jgi:hypothetical protein
MKQLSVVLAAFVGLGLIVFGVFLLGREIGMEGRVTAQPEPLGTPVQVANTGGGGGGGPSATVESGLTTPTLLPELTLTPVPSVTPGIAETFVPVLSTILTSESEGNIREPGPTARSESSGVGFNEWLTLQENMVKPSNCNIVDFENRQNQIFIQETSRVWAWNKGLCYDYGEGLCLPPFIRVENNNNTGFDLQTYICQECYYTLERGDYLVTISSGERDKHDASIIVCPE